MAKKKRKPRPRTGSGSGDVARANGSPAKVGVSRQERKERARTAKEVERKRQARKAAVRRAGIFGVVGLVSFGVLWYVQRAPGPGAIPAAAVATASAAGCTPVTQPLADAPGGQHLQPGQTTSYDQHPATSGVHAPTPLPTTPDVYTNPVDETQAVHFLEHAGVILYYRADGADALPDATVARLAQVAHDRRNTLLIPYPDLPDGEALALAAWNRLQTCPSSVPPDQAAAIANAFVDAFVCTSNAPEPKASPDC
jgi:Protein of unknown function (DUF3105)